jgi:hypothetical protein
MEALIFLPDRIVEVARLSAFQLFCQRLSKFHPMTLFSRRWNQLIDAAHTPQKTE